METHWIFLLQTHTTTWGLNATKLPGTIAQHIGNGAPILAIQGDDYLLPQYLRLPEILRVEEQGPRGRAVKFD